MSIPFVNCAWMSDIIPVYLTGRVIYLDEVKNRVINLDISDQLCDFLLRLAKNVDVLQNDVDMSQRLSRALGLSAQAPGNGYPDH